MYRISIVVPIFNERESIEKLYREIKHVCEKNHYIYEIIFVDDGSDDNTGEVAKNLKPLVYIRMRRNFGQTAAMDAGIKEARYDYIVTMDGDGQNDPEDIPEMIRYLEENKLDVVSGWRKRRKDTPMKRFTSRGAYLLRKVIVRDQIHDSGCSLKLYKKECFEGMNLYGEIHRFIPAILISRGFLVGETVVNHRPRLAGKTKYNWKRTIKGFVDMVSVWFWHKFASRPMHLMGGCGIIFLFFGLLCSLWTVGLFIGGEDLSDNFQPILTALFLMAGLLLFISGIISDMLVKIYYGAGIDSPYNIQSIERFEDERFE